MCMVRNVGGGVGKRTKCPLDAGHNDSSIKCNPENMSPEQNALLKHGGIMPMDTIPPRLNPGGVLSYYGRHSVRVILLRGGILSWIGGAGAG